MSNESFEVYPNTLISCLYFLYFIDVFYTCSVDHALVFLLMPTGKGELAFQGLWIKSQASLHPRETKRDGRNYLQQHPRKLTDIPCVQAVNRWESVFTAMFSVIQQTFTGHLWWARPCASNRGREDEQGTFPWPWGALGLSLCGVGRLWTSSQDFGDRSLVLGRQDNLLWQLPTVSQMTGVILEALTSITEAGRGALQGSGQCFPECSSIRIKADSVHSRMKASHPAHWGITWVTVEIQRK